MNLRIHFILFLLLFIVSCEKLGPKALPDDELLDGPVEGLTGEQHQLSCEEMWHSMMKYSL